MTAHEHILPSARSHDAVHIESARYARPLSGRKTDEGHADARGMANRVHRIACRSTNSLGIGSWPNAMIVLLLPVI